MPAAVTKKKIRTLRDLARVINELNNGYRATIEQSRSSTDRKPRGFRYITHKGKGRKGLRIKVYAPGNIRPILDHDTSETYRTVREAVEEAEKLFGSLS